MAYYHEVQRTQSECGEALNFFLFLSWGMLSFRVGIFFCIEGKRMHEGKT